MIERIAGIKINFDTITTQQLTDLIEIQQSRVYETQNDLQKVLGHAMMRGIVSSEQVWPTIEG